MSSIFFLHRLGIAWCLGPMQAQQPSLLAYPFMANNRASDVNTVMIKRIPTQSISSKKQKLMRRIREKKMPQFKETSTLGLFKPEQGCHLIAISAKQSKRKTRKREKWREGRGGKEIKREKG